MQEIIAQTGCDVVEGERVRETGGGKGVEKDSKEKYAKEGVV